MSSSDGSSRLGSDQQEEYYNRGETPSRFGCAGHEKDHDINTLMPHEATGFVVFATSDGQGCIPVCDEVAQAVIAALDNANGVRYVNKVVSRVGYGQIFGVLANF